MRSTRIRNAFLMASAIALVGVANSAQAALVNWDINPAESFLRLAIGDTPFNVPDIGNVTLRVRSQNSNTNWTVGNQAPVDGTISTNYLDGSLIQFLPNQTNIVGVNSGSYRPNIAVYNGTFAPNGTASGGTFTNTTTQSAVFGAKVRVSALGGLVNADAAFINFYNVFYELQSGNLALTGTTSSFTNTTTIGILDSRLAVDGQTVLGQTVVDDQVTDVGGATAANTGAAGSVTDLGGQSRRLVVPIALTLVIPLDETYSLTATASGQIVAYADVPIIPEPSTIVMLGMGSAALGLTVYRRRRSK